LGQDTLTGKEHCKNEVSFHFHRFATVFVNPFHKITPYDPAVKTHVHAIPFEKQFCDTPTNEYQIQKKQEIIGLRN